jgi:dCMP deaminase
VHGVAIEGATLYTTLQPCVLCAKMLINCGVREIHYVEGYPDELSRSMFDEAGVVVVKEDLP